MFILCVYIDMLKNNNKNLLVIFNDPSFFKHAEMEYTTVSC
jgi:hypothetical protein